MATETNRQFTTGQLDDHKLLKSISGFTDHYEEVNGINLHFVRGGRGHPLILLPGYPETWSGNPNNTKGRIGEC